MAVTIAHHKRVAHPGGGYEHYVDITGPASYTTGGEALSAADIEALTMNDGVIGDIDEFDSEHSVAGHGLTLDRANSKVLYFNGTTQIANATNLSAVVARVCVRFGIKQAI